MAVNKVEYIKDSKTPGFAVVGDEKTVNTTTAKTIKEDVEEKNTEELTIGQNNYLNKMLSTSTDNTNYDVTTGDETLPPEDADNPEGGENDPKTRGRGNNSGATVATLGSMGALGATAAGGAAITAIADQLFAQSMQVSTTQEVSIMNANIAPVIAGITVGIGAASIASAALFDGDLSQRLSEADAAAEYIATIDEYLAAFDNDASLLASLNGEATGPETVPAAPPEGTPAQPPEGEDGGVPPEEALQALYAALEEAKANGDEALVAEITAKIQEIEAVINPEGADGAEGPSPEEIKTQITANNTGAHEIAEYTSEVSGFLKQGFNLGALATLNSVMLGACGALTGILAVKSFLGAILPWQWALGTVGAALCGVAAGLFAGSATTMAVKAANEFSCAKKGKELQTKLGTLTGALPNHDKLVETVDATEEVPGTGSEDGEGGITVDIPTGGEGGSTGGEGSSTGGSGGTSTPTA